MRGIRKGGVGGKDEEAIRNGERESCCRVTCVPELPGCTNGFWASVASPNPPPCLTPSPLHSPQEAAAGAE